MAATDFTLTPRLYGWLLVLPATVIGSQNICTTGAFTRFREGEKGKMVWRGVMRHSVKSIWDVAQNSVAGTHRRSDRQPTSATFSLFALRKFNPSSPPDG